MGSSKKQTVGYWYKILYHAGLSKGPIDAFLEFRGGDKTAWSGELTASGTININQPKLWGGEKDQGGIVSDVDVMFGESTQAANAYMLANLGPQVPAWRGLATLVFKGGKYGAMNPYPQKASYKIRKILQGWDGGAAWYPAKAPVGKIMSRAPVASPNGWFPYSTGWLNVGCGQEWGGSATAWQEWFQGYIDSVRITKGVSRYSVTGYAVPSAEFDTSGADPYWSNVLACLLFNGANGSTTITDAKGHTCTAYGGAALSTAQSKFGGSSCYFDGVNDRVQINFTPGDENLGNTFTLEAWVYREGADVTSNYGRPIISAGPLSTSNQDTNWSIFGDKLTFVIDDLQHGGGGNVGVTATAEPIGTGQWYFVSLSHDGATGLYYLHVNGVLATGSPDMAASMNPAHVLYFARTNSDLGREPTANISSASLTAAADTLYAEGFGICTTRDPAQESVEEFEQRICKLIDGSFSRDPITGLWNLDLARGNYVLGSLPILTDDDILEFKEIPSTLDNAINSVSVTYFDPEKKETITTPPVQARGLIAAFGTIHQTIEYPEIPTATLAARVALRELRATATPTRAFDLVCTRKPYAWRPNTYFRLQLPKRGIADMVCIVGEKESGSLKSGAIRLKAAQDIYSMPTVSFVDVEPGVDTSPSPTPVPITLQAAFEAPYIEVVGTLSRADLDVLPADVGYLAAVAAAPATGINYTVMVDAGAGYTETANGDWCPTATVVAASSWLDTAFTLTGGTRLDEVVMGSAALWDAEIVRVDAINPTTGAITLARACADTLPAEHAAGSRIWFYQDNEAVDLTEYTDGETLGVKLLTNTASRQLDILAATPMPVGILGRAVLPYPPADIQINGAYYPTADLLPTDSIVVTYAHRDRLLQADQLVDWTQASIGPEPGVTYSGTLAVVGGATLETITGVTAATMTFAAPGLFDADLLLELWSVRSTYESRHWSYQVHTAAGIPLRWAINRDYSYQVTPTGGTGPYTYAVLSGALPTGLTLNTSTGVISGTPSVAGAAAFTIRITDSLAATEDQLFAYTTVADASWASVVALLPMDGADGSTTFTDLTGKRTITVGGSAQIDTAQSVFGGASALFAKATQDYLRFDGHTDWQFGSGDFTVEFRIRKSANSANGEYIGLFKMRDGDTYGAFALQDNRDSTGTLTFSAGTTGTSWDLVGNAGIDALQLNAWRTLTVERSGVNLRVYKNGAVIGTWNIGTATLAWDATWQPTLGGQSGTNRSLAGWIDEFRVTKGVARHGGAYTPDDIPFPAG